MKKTWLAFAVAVALICANAVPESNAPGAPYSASEHGLLKELHEQLLQLQLTELSLKNRRDSALENDLGVAVEQARATREFALRHREELPRLFEESEREAYTRLHEAFGDRRYGIYARLERARRLILRLDLMDTALGAADEGAALYNHILDNLYGFGISVSPGESPALQGILFGATPQEAAVRYQRLRYRPGEVNAGL